MLMDPLPVLLGIFMLMGVFLLIGTVVLNGNVVFFAMIPFSITATPLKERSENIDNSVNPAKM